MHARINKKSKLTQR